MRRSLLFLLLSWLISAVNAQSPGSESGYKYFLAGNKEDVQTKTEGGVLLAGGGKDVDAAFEWLLRKSGGGDIVILRASGGPGYHDYLTKLGKVDSVETIVFEDGKAARDPFVLERIRKAEAIFFAGGDQWNYVRMWRDSPVEDAIHEQVRKGVPVGGTSAGLAILGQYSFSAEKDTVQSPEALADAFDPKVTIASGFLALRNLECLITDSHFARRDRMGRLLIFLGRIRQESKCSEVYGLGVDERTAVLMEPDGSAQVVGEAAAYLVRLKAKPQLRPGEKASAGPFAVVKVNAGSKLDLRRRKAEGAPGYELRVQSGTVTSSKSDGNY
jgi:cyanophycinase